VIEEVVDVLVVVPQDVRITAITTIQVNTRHVIPLFIGTSFCILDF